ncbi:MAG TPA: amino acid permease [Steroidobacteraceae bacterium]|jgi:APA family basic amino acid/polyamine antiporter|nr:amino acid permease [Steroidobacteraceae bacterium]
MNWRIKPLAELFAAAEDKPLKRSLGAFQLIMLGVGSVIGTGIFVLSAEAAQKAGPGMMISFVLAAFTCAFTALCYAELASMVPLSGSAYTYSYVVLGELIAWMVGWALILEYAVAASAVSVGWSNYFIGLLERTLSIDFPDALSRGPALGGLFNLPAMIIGLLMTGLLVIGTRESATVNAVLATIKVLALVLFVALTLPAIQADNFEPFSPTGFFGEESGMGIAGAAASIFFAYIGFDTVSTAAEETRNPQRNMPIAVIGSLIICTVFYLLVSAGAVGSIGAQPVIDPATGMAFEPGSSGLAAACAAPANARAFACSPEPLAHVISQLGWRTASQFIGLAAFLAMPAVVLMMLFGQTRIFFAMARDGLLPFNESLSRIHPRFKTPYVVTLITGVGVTIFASLFPVGVLADISNSGTLFAFMTVALGVIILRRRDPQRPRPFRTPAIWLLGPLALGSCIFLFWSLSLRTKTMFVCWTLTGLVVYALYGYRKSPMQTREVAIEEQAR